jgi:hypothetical protein
VLTRACMNAVSIDNMDHGKCEYYPPPNYDNVSNKEAWDEQYK